jgi:hypothetical protein
LIFEHFSCAKGLAIMKNKLPYIALFLVVSIFLSFKSLSVFKTENQKYRLVKKEVGYEIRFYPQATLATINSSGTDYKSVASNGFRKLAGYIFGGNDQGKSISMTAPVHMAFNEKGSTMSFVMPEKYTEATLPVPKDENVHISKSTAQYVAVITFNGYATDEKIKEQQIALKQLLDKNKVKTTGDFTFLGYNAPYQFIGRKNEVIIPIEWKE